LVYLYPSYATYKTLARRPGTEQDVEKWLIYWCVIGAFVAFETSLEWLVNWVWLYTEIKTLFLVFLSQGGANILYQGYLRPQFEHYEPKIDAHLAAIRTRTLAYLQHHFQSLYKLVLGSVGVAQNDPTPPPSNAAPAQGAAGVASDLWNTYGSSVLAAGAKYMGSPASANQSRAAAPPSPNANAHSSALDPNGPRFPVPDFSSGGAAQRPAYIPLPSSNSNIPLRTPSPGAN